MVGVVRVPERTLEKLKNSIPIQFKVCFFSAIIVGLIAHFYKITNWLPNWDSLVFRYDIQNMTGLGRWFLGTVCAFTSFYDLPFLNGIIAIIFHALSAVCICKILNIKENITAFLIGALVVSFPTVTSIMMYSYVADGYSVAFFMSCLAAYYMTREKPNYIFAILLIAFSCGIYQAYITVTIMLVLAYLITEMIYDKKNVMYIIKKSAAFLLTGFFGMILYYAILTAITKITGVSLIDYQGFGSSTSFLNVDIIGSLYRVKETFINYFFDFSHGLNVFVILNCLIFVITVSWHLKYALQNKIVSSFPKALILFVFAVFLAIGSAVLAFINAGIDYHNLMLMGYSIFYVYFIVLYEYGQDKKEHTTYAKKWIVLLICMAVIFNNIVISNVSYHKAQMAYEKSYGTLIRIADRIETTPYAKESDEILVIGALDMSKMYSSYLPPDITGITDGYIIRADDETVGQSVLCAALNDYCGKEYNFISGERKKLLMQKDEIKSMQLWPLKDSVKVVDGIIIINLGLESEQ